MGHLDHRLRVHHEDHHSIGSLYSKYSSIFIKKIKFEPYHDVNDTKTFLPGLEQRTGTRTNYQE
jgi:hypothetical protein